ncbi:MAG: hypothetical protein KAG95_01500 [Bacteroidales bacterium]|nr:hypothetical protein [Bacteroidales bacterium]
MKLKTIFWIIVFAVSMGFFESAIVIYLRQIIYPGGFVFPLQPIDKELATIEIIREAFSMLMLLSVSILTGKSAITRFAYFLFSFAVWDIFYYIFLKMLINWPESLMTMDILFLLPVTWIGPVIAPLILSFIMILLALLILYFSFRNKYVQLKTRELLILIIGSLIIIISFTIDYTNFIISHYSFVKIWSLPVNDLFKVSVKYYPENFHWNIFGVGVIFILIGIGIFTNRNILITKNLKRLNE